MKLSRPIYRLKHCAKLLARSENIALNEALDRIAREEGFAAWSLLSAQMAASSPAQLMLSRLTDGDVVLLGARPGQGKTLLGLRLLLDAAREGRRAVFFTLEYSEREARTLVRSLDDGADALEIATSDAIGADFIIDYLAGSRKGTIAVVDYLQILDQQRSKPALADQLLALRAFARETGIILAFVSQIDRSFDPEHKAMPDIGDIRLPNPVAAGTFSKACFLHDGAIRLREMG